MVSNSLQKLQGEVYTSGEFIIHLVNKSDLGSNNENTAKVLMVPKSLGAVMGPKVKNNGREV